MSMAQRTDEMTRATNVGTAKLEKIGELMRRHSKEASISTKQISSTMDSAYDNLRNQLQALSGAYEKAETGMSALAGSMGSRATEIDVVTTKALGKINHWDKLVRESANILGQTAEEVNKQAETVTEALKEQTEEMKLTVGDASELVVALKAHTKEAGLDDFLRRATFISERLQSLAVDMSRLMETSITENDWKRFNKGEKGLFVRKMLGFREKARLASIKQRYQNDQEFRNYVSRYLDEFKSFLAEANKRDQQGVLSTIFLSSDMGKLYMVLTQALGREILAN